MSLLNYVLLWVRGWTPFTGSVVALAGELALLITPLVIVALIVIGKLLPRILLIESIAHLPTSDLLPLKHLWLVSVDVGVHFLGVVHGWILLLVLLLILIHFLWSVLVVASLRLPTPIVIFRWVVGNVAFFFRVFLTADLLLIFWLRLVVLESSKILLVVLLNVVLSLRVVASLRSL